MKKNILYMVIVASFLAFFGLVYSNDYNSYKYVLGDIDYINQSKIDEKFDYPDVYTTINQCDKIGSVEINGIYTGKDMDWFFGWKSDIECTGGYYEKDGKKYTGGQYKGGTCKEGYYTGDVYYNLGYCKGGVYKENGKEYTGGVYKLGICFNGQYEDGETKNIYLNCKSKTISIKDLYNTGSKLLIIEDSNFSENKIYTTDSSYGKKYVDGKDYVFSNIDKISSLIEFDAGSIVYIDENFLDYDHNTQKFLIKDVCEDNDCSIDNIENIKDMYLSYSDIGSETKFVRNLKRNITTADLLADNNLFLFKNTSISKTRYTAGDNLGTVVMGLAINLPYNTASGDRFEYEYNIFVQDDQGNKYALNTDKFVIYNSGGVLGLYGYKYDTNGCIDKNVDGLCDLFPVSEVFDGDPTSISMEITGSFLDVAIVKIVEKGTSIQKAGSFKFGVGLSIKGLSEDPLVVNNLSDLGIVVNPGDIDINNSIIKLTTTIPDSKVISSHEIVHFKGNSDILNFNLVLKDSYGNSITKTVTVCYNDNVKLDNNDNIWEKKCKVVKYMGSYNFRMYFLDYGKYENIKMSVDGNNIGLIRKDNNLLTINVISDAQAANEGYYDTFNCTNKNIHYAYVCSYDIGPAGCYTEKKKIVLDNDGNIISIDACNGGDCNLNYEYTYTSESEDKFGSDPSSLVKPVYIMDKAGNITRKLLLMSHIDKTPPKIFIPNSLYSDNKFDITVDDSSPNYPLNKYPGGCVDNGKYKFILSNLIVKKDGNVVYSRTNWVNNLIFFKGIFSFYDTDSMVFYKKPGKYDINLTVTDNAGNSSTVSKTITILPNTNYSIRKSDGSSGIDIQYNGSSSIADGTTVFTGRFRLVDSYGNNIFGNYYNRYPFSSVEKMMELWDKLEISSDPVVIDEITGLTGGIEIIGKGFDSRKGMFYIKFSALNNYNVGSLKLRLRFKKYDQFGNILSDVKDIDVSQTLSLISLFKKGKVYDNTGKEIGSHNGFYISKLNNAVLGFNMDIPISLNIVTTGFSRDANINVYSVSAKFWAGKDGNCNNIDPNVEILPGTGYEDILEDLKGEGYSLNKRLFPNSKISQDLIIRLENRSGYGSDYVLCGSGWVRYYINNAGTAKFVRKKINWVSPIFVKYWGVYVKGQYTINSKGLYELLRRSSSNSNMSQSATTISKLKIKLFNQIIKRVTQAVRGISNYSRNISSSINGVYYNKGDIILNSATIEGRSLVFADGGNVYIKGNIRKETRESVLTIIAREKENEGGYIYIDPSVTNIDAIIVAENGIYPSIVDDNGSPKIQKLLDIVNGTYNDQLNNQLVIYGLVISKGNTIGGSIRIDDKYILPGGKKLVANRSNFYKAAIKDLNYLRRYHYNFNRGMGAKNPINGNMLDENKYGTYPVIIWYDSAIKTSKPYGF